MKVYSFQNLAIYVNGLQGSGYADGDGVVMVEYDGKATSVVGADGKMALFLTANKSGKVTLKFLATSDFNAILMGLYELQRSGPNTFVPLEFGAKDSYRDDVIAGIHGYFSEPPKIGRGEKADMKEWQMTFEQVYVKLGNPVFAGLATAVAEAAGAA